MALQFKKAKKSQSKLRMTIASPAGGGKTYSALAIGSHLGKRIGVIDTERGSASKYSDIFQFKVLELDSFSPQTYVEAINTAAAEGFDVLIIDSLSHSWFSDGGALEQADNASKRSGENRFTAWRTVTPQYNKMFSAILNAPMHVIATMRVKTDYVMEQKDNGKTVPKRVGLAPIIREGSEYEFDVVANMNLNNEMIIEKTRCPALSEGVFKKPGKDVADILNKWLSDGEPEEIKPPPAQDAPVPSRQAFELSQSTLDYEGWLAEIHLCTSMAALDDLLAKRIRKLPAEMQKALVAPFKEQKAKLQIESQIA